MSELVIIGGGEHARVLFEAARSAEWTIAGFVDPLPCEPMQALGARWLGADDEAFIRASGTDRLFVVGLGAVGVATARQRLAARYQSDGARFATVAHARAVVSSSALLEPGAVIFAGAVVNAGARIGAHAIVNTSAVIEHDVRLGAFVHVGPAAALGGGAQVGDGSYLGLGCRVRDHITIGAGVTIGMGAVVVAPVAGGAVALGCPARERLP